MLAMSQVDCATEYWAPYPTPIDYSSPPAAFYAAEANYTAYVEAKWPMPEGGYTVDTYKFPANAPPPTGGAGKQFLP